MTTRKTTITLLILAVFLTAMQTLDINISVSDTNLKTIQISTDGGQTFSAPIEYNKIVIKACDQANNCQIILPAVYGSWPVATGPG